MSTSRFVERIRRIFAQSRPLPEGPQKKQKKHLRLLQLEDRRVLNATFALVPVGADMALDLNAGGLVTGLEISSSTVDDGMGGSLDALTFTLQGDTWDGVNAAGIEVSGDSLTVATSLFQHLSIDGGGQITQTHGFAVADLTIANAASVTLTQAVNDFDTVSIQAAGPVAVTDMDDLGIVTIDAGMASITIIADSIFDADDLQVDLIGGHVTLTTINGIGVGNALETQIGSLTASTSAAGADIEIDELDDLAIVSVSASNSSTFTLTAGGSITDGDVSGPDGVDISVGTVHLTSTAGSIGASTNNVFTAAVNALEIDAEDGTLTAATGAVIFDNLSASDSFIVVDHIQVIELAADSNLQNADLTHDHVIILANGTTLTLDDPLSVAGDLRIEAAAVVGDGPGGVLNLVADRLFLSSQQAQEVNSTVTQLQAVIDGNFEVVNSGALTLIDLNGSGAALIIAGGGSITASSPLTISADVNVNASTDFTAGNSNDPNDDLIINNNAVVTLDTTAADSVLKFTAGDDIIFDTGRIMAVEAGRAHSVILIADAEGAGVADGDRGSITNSPGIVSVTAANLSAVAADGIGDSSGDAGTFPANALRVDIENIFGAGLVTNDLNASINLDSVGSVLNVNAAVTANGSGAVRLNADTGTITLAANVASGTGAIEISGDVIQQNANVMTAGAGAVTVTADNGSITMADGTTTTTANGAIVYSAAAHVALSLLRSTNGTIAVTADADMNGTGAITDNTLAETPNLETSAAVTLMAAQGIGGAAAADINTAVGTLTAVNSTTGNIVIRETNTLIIGGAGVQTSGGNGSIDIDVDAGSLTVNSAVTANGSGAVRLNADTGTITLAANVASGTGAIEISGDVIQQNANVMTAGAGAVTVTADNGSITMADGTTTTTDSGNISYVASFATADVTLTLLMSTAGDVSVTAGRNIVDGDIIIDDLDISGNNIMLTAINGSIGTLPGSVFKDDFDGLEIFAHGNITAFANTAGQHVVVHVDLGGVLTVNATTAVILAAGDLDATTPVLTVDNLALIADANNNGVGTLTLPAVLTVTGDLRVQGADVEAIDGTIDLVANRILFGSLQSETIRTITSTLDARAGGDLTVLNNSASLDLVDLNCDNVALQTTNSSGSIVLSSTGHVVINDDVIAGNDGLTTSAGGVLISADSIVVSDLILTDDGDIQIFATNDINFDTTVGLTDQTEGVVGLDNDDLYAVTTINGDITIFSGGAFVQHNGHRIIAGRTDAMPYIPGVDGLPSPSTVTLDSSPKDPSAARVFVQAGNDVTIASVQSANPSALAIQIFALNGAVIDGGDVHGDIIAVQAGALTTIEARNGIGDGNAIETDVTRISARNTTIGNIQIAENNAIDVERLLHDRDGSILLAAGGSIHVLAAGTGVVVDDVGNTGGNADIVLESTGGNILVNQIVRNDSTHADADITLRAHGTNSDVDVNAAVTSAAGDITIGADDTVHFTFAGDTTANGAGNVLVRANMVNTGGDSGDQILMADGTVINAGSGTVTLTALGSNGGNITLGQVVTFNTTADAVRIVTGGGAVLDGGDLGGADIIAGQAGALTTIEARNGIGDGNAIETDVTRISARNTTIGNIQIAENNAIDVERLLHDRDGSILLAAGGSIHVLAAGTGVVVDDVGNTGGNANIVLESAGGNILVNQIVRNDSTHADADIRIQAQSGMGDVTIASQIGVAAGSVEIQAADSVFFSAAGVIGAVGAGDVSILANTNSLPGDDGNQILMADGAVVDAGSGTITMAVTGGASSGNITLSSLRTSNNTLNGVHIITTGGAIVDGGDTHLDVDAPNARLFMEALNGIGHGNPLNVNVLRLYAENTVSGGIEIVELDAILVERLYQQRAGDIRLTAGSDIDILAVGTGVVIDDLTNSGADVDILLVSSNGSILVNQIVRNDSTHSHAEIALTAEGINSDVELNAAVSSAAGSISIASGDSVGFTSTGTITAVGAGNVLVQANAVDLPSDSGNRILMADGAFIDAGSGTISLLALGSNAGNITAEDLTTTGDLIHIESESGNVIIGNASGAVIRATDGQQTSDETILIIGRNIVISADVLITTDGNPLPNQNRLDSGDQIVIAADPDSGNVTFGTNIEIRTDGGVAMRFAPRPAAMVLNSAFFLQNPGVLPATIDNEKFGEFAVLNSFQVLIGAAGEENLLISVDFRDLVENEFGTGDPGSDLHLLRAAIDAKYPNRFLNQATIDSQRFTENLVIAAGGSLVEVAHLYSTHLDASAFIAEGLVKIPVQFGVSHHGSIVVTGRSVTQNGVTNAVLEGNISQTSDNNPLTLETQFENGRAEFNLPTLVLRPFAPEPIRPDPPAAQVAAPPVFIPAPVMLVAAEIVEFPFSSYSRQSEDFFQLRRTDADGGLLRIEREKIDSALGELLLQPLRLKQWLANEDLQGPGLELWLITTKQGESGQVTIERPVLKFDVSDKLPFPSSSSDQLPETILELKLEPLPLDGEPETKLPEFPPSSLESDQELMDQDDAEDALLQSAVVPLQQSPMHAANAQPAASTLAASALTGVTVSGILARTRNTAAGRMPRSVMLSRILKGRH